MFLGHSLLIVFRAQRLNIPGIYPPYWKLRAPVRLLTAPLFSGRLRSLFRTVILYALRLHLLSIMSRPTNENIWLGARDLPHTTASLRRLKLVLTDDRRADLRSAKDVIWGKKTP